MHRLGLQGNSQASNARELKGTGHGGRIVVPRHPSNEAALWGEEHTKELVTETAQLGAGCPRLESQEAPLATRGPGDAGSLPIFQTFSSV